MSYAGPTMHRVLPGEPDENYHETFKVFPPVAPPALYSAPKLGKVKAFMVDDAEVDRLRITAIRRCTQILADITKLQKEPATLADVLRGPDALKKLLVERVDFDGAEAVEKAMDRLESVLGTDAQVLEPRAEFGPGYVSLASAREQVDALAAAMKGYRAMRAQLK